MAASQYAVVPLSLEEQNALMQQEVKDLERRNAELERKLDAAVVHVEEHAVRERDLKVFGGKQVNLNVGGVRMSTTLETLTQGRAEGSLLAMWFCGLHGGGGHGHGEGHHACEPGEDGLYFIDRDPAPFTSVLSWLRTGKCPLSGDAIRQAVLEEAKFFKV
jgi:hypothetical protein